MRLGITVAWTLIFISKVFSFLLEKQEEIKNFIKALIKQDIEKVIIFLIILFGIFVLILIILIYLLGEKSREDLKKDNFLIFDLNS